MLACSADLRAREQPGERHDLIGVAAMVAAISIVLVARSTRARSSSDRSAWVSSDSEPRCTYYM
jgi:hypothetical protein